MPRRTPPGTKGIYVELPERRRKRKEESRLRLETGSPGLSRMLQPSPARGRCGARAAAQNWATATRPPPCLILVGLTVSVTAGSVAPSG